MTRMPIIRTPGSGEGTLAERISQCLGAVAISTGGIFRANVKTPLGLAAKKYIGACDFVSSHVTNNAHEVVELTAGREERVGRLLGRPVHATFKGML
ncbi:adenylate kinase family enzyme [Arthrobacter sp. AZCC_0090]|nr:adenylate kinase family enzyme [Arthrobacter sp. AZCC_0090]